MQELFQIVVEPETSFFDRHHAPTDLVVQRYFMRKAQELKEIKVALRASSFYKQKDKHVRGAQQSPKPLVKFHRKF